MKISAVIITNNESKYFFRSIVSIKDIVDEITVIDTRNTNQKLKVAYKFTQNVFKLPFQNDMSIIRNYALSRSDGEWILVVDDDEIFSDEAKLAIRTLIKDKNYDGYWFRRRWYIDDQRYLKYGLFYPDYSLRLFRKSSKFRYIHRVHEEVTIPIDRTKQTLLDIYHFNSLYKYLTWKGFKKLNKYVMMLSMMHRENGYSTIKLILKAITSFFNMFIMGLLRGKGILDGWIGIKAHFFFAWSITKGYLKAI